MNSQKDWINWFWQEFDRVFGQPLNPEAFQQIPPMWCSMFRRGYSSSHRYGLCQCETEYFIANSKNPPLMRSFLITGILIDQMMYTHFKSLYDEFRGQYCYPKLYAHLGSDMATPSWLIYRLHGYDRKMEWDTLYPVAQALMSGLFAWFASCRGDVVTKFKVLTRKEIVLEFGNAHAEKILLLTGDLLGYDTYQYMLPGTRVRLIANPQKTGELIRVHNKRIFKNLLDKGVDIVWQVQFHDEIVNHKAINMEVVSANNNDLPDMPPFSQDECFKIINKSALVKRLRKPLTEAICKDILIEAGLSPKEAIKNSNAYIHYDPNREEKEGAKKRRQERATKNLVNAVRRGDFKAVQALLKNGADVQKAYPEGDLREFALQNGHKAVAELISNNFYPPFNTV